MAKFNDEIQIYGLNIRLKVRLRTVFKDKI